MKANFSSLATTLPSSDNQTLHRNHFTQMDWIIPMTVSVILTIFTLWILICLIHYGIKTGKWWRDNGTQQLDNKMNIGLIYTTIVSSAVICLCIYAINFVYLNIGFHPNDSDLCDNVADTAVGFYALLLLIVNIFYWLRQRVFFKSKLLNMEYNKYVCALSSVSIIIIFFGGVCALLANVIPDNRQASDNGCIFRPENSLRAAYWVPFIVVLALGQGMLYGLFGYALKKSAEFTTNNIGEANNAKTNQDIRKILKKTLFFAITSTLVDFFNQMFSYYISESKEHRRYVTTTSNINAFLNVLFLLLSFVQYKKILTSPFRQ